MTLYSEKVEHTILSARKQVPFRLSQRATTCSPLSIIGTRRPSNPKSEPTRSVCGSYHHHAAWSMCRRRRSTCRSLFCARKTWAALDLDAEKKERLPPLSGPQIHWTGLVRPLKHPHPPPPAPALPALNESRLRGSRGFILTPNPSWHGWVYADASHERTTEEQSKRLVLAELAKLQEGPGGVIENATSGMEKAGDKMG